MKQSTFNAEYKKRMAAERALVTEKGNEYSQDCDRFSNFKNAVHLQVPGTTPEGAAWNMMSKHLEAAMLGLRNLAIGVPMSDGFWDEKLGDIIIYTRLIAIMLAEREE